jgi:hypothetical protein
MEMGLGVGTAQRLENVSLGTGRHKQWYHWVWYHLSIAMFHFPKCQSHDIKDRLATTVLKGNLKLTSRLCQDDIFQDVFQNVGLVGGDDHC